MVLRLLRRLRMAIWRSTVERDVDEEMRRHLEPRQAQLVSERRSPAEARDQARRRFRAVRQASTLDAAYICDSFTKTLGGSEFPESVWTEYYTGNALSLLGVQPVIGRVFTEADAPIGPDPQRVAVLTYRFWQRRFAGQ